MENKSDSINTQWGTLKKGDRLNYCAAEYLTQEIITSYWY
jgi:hypothetical protein